MFTAEIAINPEQMNGRDHLIFDRLVYDEYC